VEEEVEGFWILVERREVERRRRRWSPRRRSPTARCSRPARRPLRTA